MPDVRLVHMETPSPFAEFGMKGVGKSGAIGPPGRHRQCDQRGVAPARRGNPRDADDTPHAILAAIAQARTQP